MSNDFIIEGTVLVRYVGTSEHVEVPSNITKIEEFAFSYKEGGLYLPHEGIKDVILPEGVFEIGSNAFWGCESLENIVIPQTCKKICSCAFSDCQKLKRITILGNITEIEYGAFDDCKELESIKISGTNVKIGDNAFCSCEALITVVLEGVTEIGNLAFWGCENLESVDLKIEDRNIKIAYDAFSCKKLSNISVSNGIIFLREKI